MKVICNKAEECSDRCWLHSREHPKYESCDIKCKMMPDARCIPVKEK